MKTLWYNLKKVLFNVYLLVFFYFKKKKKKRATDRSCSVKCVYRLNPFKWKLKKKKRVPAVQLCSCSNKINAVSSSLSIYTGTQLKNVHITRLPVPIHSKCKTCWAADLTPAQNAIDRGTDDMPKTGPFTKANEFKGMSFVLSCLQLSSENGIEYNPIWVSWIG